MVCRNTHHAVQQIRLNAVDCRIPVRREVAVQKAFKSAGVLRCVSGKLISFELRQCSVVNTHVINESAVGIA